MAKFLAIMAVTAFIVVGFPLILTFSVGLFGQIFGPLGIILGLVFGIGLFIYLFGAIAS